MPRAASAKSPEGRLYAHRKLPRQQRSRTTVESIKQAALLLLNEEGLGALGTDRIAEKAGVSIGSLYQYFPNREAILKALYEDISIEYADAIKNKMLQILDMPTETAVARIMDTLVAMHDRSRLVLLSLVAEMPELRLAEQPLSFSNLTRSSIRAYVMHRRGALKPRELDRMVFFVEQIILGCISTYLREQHPRISRKEFTQDLSRIVAAYING